MVFDGHAHESMAIFSNTPTAGMRDLGDEAADVEPLEDAGNPGPEFALEARIRVRLVKCAADVTIT